jgi:hypothetical protein
MAQGAVRVGYIGGGVCALMGRHMMNIKAQIKN